MALDTENAKDGSFGTVDDLPNDPRLPPALNKALADHFACAVGLKGGTVIVAESAELVGGDWIHLQLATDSHGNEAGDRKAVRIYGGKPTAMTFDRGIDIRISEIAWAADAPYGS